MKWASNRLQRTDPVHGNRTQVSLETSLRRVNALPLGGLGRPPRADAWRPVTPCPHESRPSLRGTYPFPAPLDSPLARRSESARYFWGH
jgi:hypothetical protein